MMTPTLTHILLVSAVLFVIGVYTVLSRRNAVTILMGVELILNSANINFVAFSRLKYIDVSGTVFATIIIVFAACEAAVALAIFLGIFRTFGTMDVDNVDSLKE